VRHFSGVGKSKFLALFGITGFIDRCMNNEILAVIIFFTTWHRFFDAIIKRTNITKLKWTACIRRFLEWEQLLKGERNAEVESSHSGERKETAEGVHTSDLRGNCSPRVSHLPGTRLHSGGSNAGLATRRTGIAGRGGQTKA
jgi:hypothetical protein